MVHTQMHGLIGCSVVIPLHIRSVLAPVHGHCTDLKSLRRCKRPLYVSLVPRCSTFQSAARDWRWLRDLGNAIFRSSLITLWCPHTYELESLPSGDTPHCVLYLDVSVMKHVMSLLRLIQDILYSIVAICLFIFMMFLVGVCNVY